MRRAACRPFIELGVGFNPDLTARDNVVAERRSCSASRPREAAGALRARDRVRRARGVPGPQAQELLLGHARAPRLLGGDPGRRRHPADRRGAGGRRRRLPAEVLRRASTACATKAGRSCSSRTTWARSSASAIVRCCSSEARSSVSAIRVSIARQYNELNFRRIGRRRSRLGGSGQTLPRTAPVAELMRGRFEHEDGQPQFEGAAGRTLLGSGLEVVFPRRRLSIPSSPSRSRMAEARRHSAAQHSDHLLGPHRGRSRPARLPQWCGSGSRTGSPPAVLPAARLRWPGTVLSPRRTTCARRSRSRCSARHTPRAALVDLPHEVSIDRVDAEDPGDLLRQPASPLA